MIDEAKISLVYQGSEIVNSLGYHPREQAMDLRLLGRRLRDEETLTASCGQKPLVQGHEFQC
jgi:hypothetical protein